MAHRFYGIGVLFDIDALDSGLYGHTAYQIFFRHVDPRKIVGCILKDGDTNETLYKGANIYCISVESLEPSKIAYVKEALSKAQDQGLLDLNERFLDEYAVRTEPLVIAGTIGINGYFVHGRTTWVTTALEEGLKYHEEYYSGEKMVQQEQKNNTESADQHENIIRFCSQCGAEAAEGSRFCIECGYKLGDIIPEPHPSKVIPHIQKSDEPPGKLVKIIKKNLLVSGLILGLLISGMIVYAKKDLISSFVSAFMNPDQTMAQVGLGNTNNDRIAVAQGDWIYYSGAKTMYKMEIGQSENRQEFSEDVGLFLTLDGDWVYYLNLDADEKLYKIRTDGSGRAKICDDIAAFINVYDGWIYYCNWSDDQKIYKIRPDGTERTKIADTPSYFMNIVGDWIYFLNEDLNGALFRMKTDGSDSQSLISDEAPYANIAGDWIYYSNRNEGGKIYKVRMDGTDKTKLNDDDSIYLNVVGDWIYYTNVSDLHKLYRIKTDGTERSVFESERMHRICVINDYFFFRNVEGTKDTWGWFENKNKEID